jgi:hypothetical protein
VVETADGRPLTSSDLAEAIAAGVTESVDDPSDPLGLALRLARELELRHSGLDLGAVPPLDAPLEPLAAALIEWDILVPFAAAEGEGLGVAAAGGWQAAMPGLVGAAGPPVMTLAAGLNAAPRTAQLCDRIRGQQIRGEWSVGRVGAGFVQLGLRALRSVVPTQALHSLLLRMKLKVTADSTVSDFHYAHDSSESSPVVVKVRVLLDADLPDSVVACGPMARVKLPRNEPVPGATVIWFDQAYAEHGSVDCGAACTTTDGQGEATWRFTPRQEPPISGLGPEHEATVRSAVRARFVLPGPSGGVPLQATRFFPDVTATWHRKYRLELAIDSTIEGGNGKGAIRGVAFASGRIPLAWDETTAALEGDGVLKVKTLPRAAKKCIQNSTSGKGIIDWQVYGVIVSPGASHVEATVGPGPTTEFPDRLKSGCPRSKPTRFSTWEGFFALSHRRDLRSGGVGGGYRLDGFVWQASDDTFRNGGELATYKYREGCPSPPGCKGRTTFTMYVYPVGD